MSILNRVICLLLGYAIGCIQSAFIVGKIIGKIDIRDFGSGNAGTTNVARVLGAKAGAIVFICDVLKVILSCVICRTIFKFDDIQLNITVGMYAGIGSVIGHNFPFYLNFKGGKGIACTLGLILCIDIKVAVITYLIGFIVVVITKYVSLSSLSMTLVAPFIMLIYKFSTENIILMFILTALAYYRHLPNIKRLLKGEENKFSFKK